MAIKDQFEFVLSDHLKMVAPHSADTVFFAERDENMGGMYNMYIISWEDEDGLGCNQYWDKDVERYINEGSWVLINEE